MGFQITTFNVDITPRLGAPLCGGAIEPATRIEDPQFARGYVLLGADLPIVQVVLDCLGTYNDTHDRLRELVAQAAGTIAERVILSSVHQHDAPIYDRAAQKILESRKTAHRICDLDDLKSLARSLQSTVKQSLENPTPVTHVGVGEAMVHEVASNRRIIDHDNRVSAVRWSACKDPAVRAEPEGLIDSMLKSMTFFNEDRPVATVSHYATHPMSHYGKGAVSADFCGLARAKRQADDPGCFQMYVTGCAGNITAGKYNDGSPENRPVLMGRIYDAMARAAGAVERHPLRSATVKVAPMMLPVREEPGFMEPDVLDMIEGVSEISTDWRRGVMCLSWRYRSKMPVQIQMVDLGAAKLLLLPGEPFVEYQLAAQQSVAGEFLMAIGYGNGGPGYLCTDVAYRQGGYESSTPAYTGVGTEAIVQRAIRQVLEEDA